MRAYEPTQQIDITSLGFTQKRLLQRLNKYFTDAQGTLRLTLPSGQQLNLGSGTQCADLQIKSWWALARLLFGGLNGWGKAYINNEWESRDLTALIRWGLTQEKQLEAFASGATIASKWDRLYHLRRDNSRQGSRENIAAHYDLGNLFYKQWLDPSMSYSSALFSSKNDTLQQAQNHKYQRITELLSPKIDDKIIEIGCGWGGFAEHASRHHQINIEGITLSQEQLAWAQQRMADHQLTDRVSLSLTDYRDLTGQYDGVVSIEMFEAVGEAHWDTYFETLHRILKPGGKAVLQIITIEDERFDAYRQQADFIQRYIFPGGMLPSPHILHTKFAQHGFTLEHEQYFGRDYARTLQYWRAAFENNWEQLTPLGFDERFKRLWRYYLGYCEGGFLSGSIDVGLFTIRRH